MRYFVIIAPLLLSGCSHMANDAWSGQDKAQHFLASAMLSAAGNEYAQHQGYSRDRSAAIGLMFSVSLGHQKSYGTAARQGAAGAGRISPGMSPAPPPAIRCGNWRINKVTNATPSLYHVASGRPGRQSPPLPSRTSRRHSPFPQI